MISTQYLPPNAPLPPHVADSTIVQHVFTAPLRHVSAPKAAQLPPSVQRLPLTPAQHEAAQHVARDIYYAPHAANLGPRYAATGEQRLAAMLAQNPQGCVAAAA